MRSRRVDFSLTCPCEALERMRVMSHTRRMRKGEKCKACRRKIVASAYTGLGVTVLGDLLFEAMPLAS